MNNYYNNKILILFRSCSCFISEVGVFFGAFLVPIILIILFNACIFIASSYVVIRLKVNKIRRNLPRKRSQKQQKFRISSKDTCKLLALLAGFMSLLGLSWIILLFTVVGADTNIYAAFAIQWLFVFLNSLQGFFLFVFFVALNRDARNLWFNFLFPCLKSNKSTYMYSSRIEHSSISGNTSSTKLSTQREFSSDLVLRRKHKKSKIIAQQLPATASNQQTEMQENSGYGQTEYECIIILYYNCMHRMQLLQAYCFMNVSAAMLVFMNGLMKVTTLKSTAKKLTM